MESYYSILLLLITTSKRKNKYNITPEKYYSCFSDVHNILAMMRRR